MLYDLVSAFKVVGRKRGVESAAFKSSDQQKIEPLSSFYYSKKRYYFGKERGSTIINGFASKSRSHLNF